MTIELSQRVGRIKPSPTLAVTAKSAELKAQGKDIVGLGAGEPDFDTPEFIKEAAIKAIRDGFTKYTPVDGLPSLKQAIIQKFERDNRLQYEPKEVVVTVGGKQGCYNLCQALLNAGDEVLIPAPYWVSYPDMALLADATPVIINASIEQHFKITPAQLEQAITPKSRLLFLNSPSNPTGIAYSAAELKALAEVLLKHPRIMIASDDMYEHILWSGEPFSNIVNVCPELKARTVVLNAVSKTYSMTGWRIGYAAGPVEIIGAMKKIQSQSTSNATAIAQKAAEAALNGDQTCVTAMVKAFKERHDFLINKLATVPGVHCLPADGTFYVFPNVQAAIDRLPGVNNDVELAEHLITGVGLALVPGSAFGSPGYVRLSFATNIAVLEEAVNRLAKGIAA